MDRKQVYENANGVRKTLVAHDDDPYGDFSIITDQRVGDVIAECQKLRELKHVVGHRKSTNLVHVCEMPMVDYQRAMIEGWANDPKKIRQWVNDPQNKPFRVTDGRL